MSSIRFYFLLVLFSLCLFGTTEAFYTNCVNGLYTCSPTEPSVTLPASTVIQHCTYVNCPTIEVPAGATVTGTNLTFLYPRGDNGVFNFAANVQGNFNLLKVSHGYHQTLSSFTIGGSGSSVNFTNANFYNNTASKGAIAITSASFSLCDRCTFQAQYRLVGGLGSAVTGNNGAYYIIRNFVVRNVTQRVFRCQQANTVCLLENGIATDISSAQESSVLIHGDTYCTMILNNVTAMRVTGNGNGGVLGTYWYPKVYVTNCYFSDIYANGQGGAFLIQFSAVAWFNNSVIERSQSASDGGAFFFYDTGTLFLTNCIVRNCISGGTGGAIDVLYRGVANITNCTIDGNVANWGGTLSVRDGSNMLVRDSTIINNYRSGLRVMDWSGSYATVDGNTIFANNRDPGGAGAIIVLDGGIVYLRGNLQIFNNAGDSGGIIQGYSAIINWESPFIRIQNNTSVNNPWASGMKLTGSVPNCLVMNFTNGVKEIYPQDYFYVNTPQIAQYILNNPYDGVCPGCQFRGLTTTLAIVPNDVQDTRNVSKSLLSYSLSTNLKVSQPLPDIKIVAIDFFSNVALASISSPVVVALTAGPNIKLQGEYRKAIVDQNTNSVTFSKVTIKDVVPGTYQINVTYIGNTVRPLPQPLPLPSLTFTYESCDPVKERLITSEAKCYPVQEMGTGLRAAFGVIGIIGAAAGLVSLFFLNKFKEYHLIRANSTIFLGIISLGCTLMFLSVTAQISSYNGSCMAASWLENLGFTLIFGSLWLKTYRILMVFNRKQRNTKNIQDKDLIRALGIVTLVVFAFLISWQIVAPSAFSEKYVSGVKVYLDPCSSSSFTVVSILIRFFVQLAMTYLAFNIRNVPDDFNESKQIGFTTYNWMIFGAIILIIKQYAVTDLQLAFAIGEASTVLTSALTLGILIYHKIYLCSTKPNNYMTPQRNTFMNEGTPVPQMNISTPAAGSSIRQSQLGEKSAAVSGISGVSGVSGI